MAVLAFWAAHYFIESKQYRYLWLLLFVATVVNSIYIAPGRTGMFILPVLMLLFASQRLSLKKQLVGLCSSLFPAGRRIFHIRQLLVSYRTGLAGDNHL